MKFILLIAFVLIFSLASSKLVKMEKNIARTIAPENLALELEFFGSCQEFEARVIPSIWISKYRGCLPVQLNNPVATPENPLVVGNPDFDDLRTHYFCTPVGRGRSVIHFVEIYENENAENTPFPNFVLSLVPSNPFRVLTQKTSVARRPDCFVTHDYCNGENAVVNSCRSNEVVYREYDEHRDGDRDGHRGGDRDGHRGGDRDGGRHKRGNDNDRDGHRGGDRDGHRGGDRHNRRPRRYIVSHDRIYITANQQVSLDCKTAGPNPVCCSYIAPELAQGICDHNGSNDLLDFPRNRNNNNHHDNDYHNNHHDNPNDAGHWQHSNGQPNIQGSWEGHHDKKEVQKQQ